VTFIENVIMKMIGVKNAKKLSQCRKSIRITVFRSIRAVFGRSERLPLLQPRVFSLPDAHLFFGYYDIPQFSGDQRFLLASAAPLINTTPSAIQSLRLGLFDLHKKKPEFLEFATTNTWCWQQGCRLQWYPYEGNSLVLFNTLIGKQYGCVIQDVNNGKIVKSFTRPIYSISRDGKWGLSIDFSRLQRLRPGYGYNVLPDDSLNDLIPVSDGVWRINMETGDELLLFSVRDISEFKSVETGAGAQHYFNHLLFNPEGDRFMFFHLWQEVDGSRKIRLLTSSIQGDDIRLLNDSGYSSHYYWKNNDHLLCYSHVVGKGEGYFLFDDLSNESFLVSPDLLTEDGHPSYLSDGRYLVTDTYPDKYGEQTLLLFDSKNGELNFLDKLFSPLQFTGETRCDFHPRVSFLKRFICIDCIVQGKRAMRLYDISPLVEEANFLDS
jgi:hypothetical protein